MNIEEKGIVIEVKSGLATVRAEESSHCAGCASKGFCQSGGGERTVEAENAVGAGPGERVVITVPSGALLKASFQVYIVPVIGLLTGAAIAQFGAGHFFGPEAAGAAAGVGGLLGAVLAVLCLRAAAKRRPADTALRPRIVRII